jgi:hypothetical protein
VWGAVVLAFGFRRLIPSMDFPPLICASCEFTVLAVWMKKGRRWLVSDWRGASWGLERVRLVLSARLGYILLGEQNIEHRSRLMLVPSKLIVIPFNAHLLVLDRSYTRLLVTCGIITAY